MTTTTTRPTARDAYRMARRRFLAGQRLDMGRLADDLGVTRVTLYRWVGSRDQFLVDVMWGLTTEVFTSLTDQLDAEDPSPRTATLLSGYVRVVATNDGIRRFLREEPELAMRLLTTKAAGFQAQLVALIHDLLEGDVESGRLTPRLPLDDLAYIAVRIGESFVYTHSIGTIGEEPDADRAELAIRAILNNCTCAQKPESQS